MPEYEITMKITRRYRKRIKAANPERAIAIGKNIPLTSWEMAEQEVDYAPEIQGREISEE